MSDYFFLNYANNPFRDSPDNISLILNKISLDIPDYYFVNHVGRLIFDLVKIFTKDNDPAKAQETRLRLLGKFFNDSFSSKFASIAYDAVYGYIKPDIRCGYDDVCSLNHKNLNATIKLSGLDSKTQLKCHECYQLSFIATLKSLVAGEYKELVRLMMEVSIENNNQWRKFVKEAYKTYKKDKLMPPLKMLLSVSNPGKNPILQKAKSLKFETARTLMDFLLHAYTCLVVQIDIDDNGNLKKNQRLSYDNLQSLKVGDPSPWKPEVRFNRFILSLVGHSLAEFIVNDDLRKLKLCQNCDEFFIAKKRDKRIKYCPICSSKCKMTKTERRKYQRKYYWETKHKKFFETRELMIQDYMDKLDCTRKEAEEMWEVEEYKPTKVRKPDNFPV